MPATRTIHGTELPAAGRWRIDPGHAEVSFVGRHFGLTRVRGRFGGVEGHVDIAGDPAESRVDVTIDMSSVDSGNADRDAHLVSADLFNVETHPTATFVSTSVALAGATARVVGDLTIAGTSRPVELAVEHLGTVDDPWGAQRAVFSARATINREDFGLTWNMVLEAGGLVVSKTIEIQVEVELVLDAA